MKLLFFCPRWGSEDLSWDEFAEKAKSAGYDGVEAGVPFDNEEKNEMATALQNNNLLLIGQYWQSFEKDFEAHKSSYQKHLNNIATLRPVKIDAQTGKDYFSFEQNKELIDIAANFTAKTGVTVAHETHRNKALFAAHVTRQYLEKTPSLNITADFSHWCNVAESFLEDQQEAMDIAIQRAIHIHARVGYTEGPQATDPRLPEWKQAVDIHLGWWKQIIDYNVNQERRLFTVTPEFGPAPYMPLAPLTQQPLAIQWELNEWMMKFLKFELKHEI